MADTSLHECLELRRLDEARQARHRHEQLIRDQIEEKKRIEAKKREDDEEPWWIRQDKRKQMTMENNRQQVNSVADHNQFNQHSQQDPVVPIVPKIDISKPDVETFDEGYRDTVSSRQPINSQVCSLVMCGGGA